MEDNTPSLFEVGDDGQIIYEPSESEADGSASLEQGESAADPEANVTEGEFENGNNISENIGEGVDVSDSVQGEEIPSETSEDEQIVYLGDSYNVELLSDEIQELLVNALSPASGTLGSTTIDYFDRIVSGLPDDVVYIAYRTSSTSSYDGVLYYSDDYNVKNNVVTFGDDTKEVRVLRSNYNGQNNVTQYYESDADGASIAFDMDGDIVYYTNAEVGYPVLGGIPQQIGYAPFLVSAIMSAVFYVVINKIIKVIR